jgi:hypothetical protein
MITHMTTSRIEYEFHGVSYTVHGEALNPDFGLDYVIYADDFHLTDPARKTEIVDPTTKAQVLNGIQAELTKRGTRFEIEGEGQGEEEGNATAPLKSDAPSSVVAGLACPRGGWWFTPAQVGSRRYFSTGDIMPTFNGDYGTTVWQWDHSQEPPRL